MSLDFRNTCPEIDDIILDYKYHTEDFLKNLISQFIPTELLDESHWKYKTFIQDSLSDLNSQILPLFEQLRKLNSEMRNSAEKQLEELQEIIGELELRKQELEGEIDMLQEELYNLK